MAGKSKVPTTSAQFTLDARARFGYTPISIYSPWDLPKGLLRGYFFACGTLKRGSIHAS